MAQGSRTLSITTREQVSMLSPEAAEQLRRFHWHWSFVGARCLMKNDDHGPQGLRPPILPYAPMRRARLYTGTRESGSYNHHSQVARFGSRYYFGWSNGAVDEEAEGQRILVSSSADGVQWGEPQQAAGGEHSTGAVHNCVALFGQADALYLVDWYEEAIRDATVTGMRRILAEKNRLRLLASGDGSRWEQIGTLPEEVKVIFEAPRLTAEGRLLCICTTTDHQPGVLLWPGGDIRGDPHVVRLPTPPGAAFPYGEGSWYQTDDGRIVAFWRDESGSCRLYVNTSDDGGRSFVPPMISDIPDSMSRVYAGRLADGRYFLCGNAFPTLLDRRHLLLLLSDDGYQFSKAYVLADDPTSQRLKGLLKADGYQYPCCLAEPNRLLIGYSVNKEDIECGALDTRCL